MKPEADGKFPYKGVFDCVSKTVSREGLLGLWVGLPVFYFRVAPQSMIVIVYCNVDPPGIRYVTLSVRT